MPNPATFPLRPAVATDEITLHRMIREARINPMDIHWERFTVIEAPDGELAAIGQVKPHRDGTWEVASIVTAPEHRGQGLARRVIEHLIAAHPGVLYLMCESHLEPLYEKFGFRAIEGADLPKYFRRMMGLTGFMQKMAGVHILVMRRTSTEPRPSAARHPERSRPEGMAQSKDGAQGEPPPTDHKEID